jgi:hypothetical protein
MVVRKVGSDSLPSRRLIEYSLTTPGIHTAIIGIGHIDADTAACQLKQNLLAAQIKPDALSVSDRRDIEKLALTAKEGKTNYFQNPIQVLGSVRDYSIYQEIQDRKRVAQITWQTAYAGDEPIVYYEIWREQQKVGQVAHTPQVSRTPFIFKETLSDNAAHNYRVLTVDATGRTAKTEDILLSGI